MSTLRVSDRGVRLVASFEGGKSPDGKFRPYWDAKGGVWTIGYGHTTGLVKRLKGRTPAWSEAKAMRVLKRQLNGPYAQAVRDLHVPLNQNQFDALVSFVYNVGPGALAPSTQLGQALRARKYRSAGDHMLDWNKAGNPPRPVPGLTNRRAAERRLFSRRIV